MFTKMFLVVMVLSLSGCSIIGYKNTENTEAAEINAKLALAYLANKNPALGKSKLLLAQKQAPSDPAIWYMSGYFLEHTGDLIAANQAYLKAVALNPTSGAAQNNYGVFLCQQGKYTAAISHFDLAAHDPNYLYTTEIYKNAAQCALKIPDKHLAEKYFNLVEKYSGKLLEMH